MKNYFFLSGIARSGSTLLGSLLNQNPEFYVSPTSPLLDLYCLTEQSIQQVKQQYTFDDGAGVNIHKYLHHAFYQDVNKRYIVDKHRGWARNIETVKKIITPDPKVICTYRPIAENIVSFLKLVNKDPNNFLDKALLEIGYPINLQNRAQMLWQNYSADPFYSMQHGLQHNRENILVINYHDLVDNPQQELDKVYAFLEIPQIVQGVHVFGNIANTCGENDNNWGLKDLHTLRPNIAKTSDDPLEVLGDELFNFFNEIDQTLTQYF